MGKIEVEAIFVGSCWIEWQSISRYVALNKYNASVRSRGHPLASIRGIAAILQSGYIA